MVHFVTELWPHLLGALLIGASVLASAHAVLYKRDVRAAIAWAGLVWLVPGVGAVLYGLLGINRIRRRALAVHGEHRRSDIAALPTTAVERIEKALGPGGAHLASVGRLSDQLSTRLLLQGNRIVPLINGDSAYPAMLEAIAKATRSIGLCSYIFDNDRAGRRFADALAAAARRGVEVRVLVDAVGLRYSWPSMHRVLNARGVRCARFMPTLVPARLPYMNLRNHRKILVVDGRIGFTGGMNIREGCELSLEPRPSHPVQDLHFRVEGPVVAHLQEVFLEDWHFSTGEQLGGEAWLPALKEAGTVLARGVSDGPDEDFETLRNLLLGALAAARRSVRIATPYFLPDSALITALNVAALRGIAVEILLPEKNNLALVQWASTAQLWQVLKYGCRVYLSPPPFDHTKLMVVDEQLCLLGSANWDPRSLRLNFEFNLECYDRALGRELHALLGRRLASARPITLDHVDRRSFPVRLRDGLARLLTPYL